MKQISFQDLAIKFSEDEALSNYTWLDKRDNPNCMGIRKCIRMFNAQMRAPIKVYEVEGYDNTKKKYLVIDSPDVARLKKFLTKEERVIEYRVLREVIL